MTTENENTETTDTLKPVVNTSAHIQRHELSGQQVEAMDAVIKWLKSSANISFRLGGYAGTGKTTLLRHFEEATEKTAAFCSFTGKAAHVMTKKGLYASTIHRLIYNVIEEGDGTFTFKLKHRSELECDVIVVDEASMISKELLNDLMSFSIPLLFVGDPGQLEPVGDDPYLMRDPDYVLTEIKRQGVDNPIIDLATAIRMTSTLPSKGVKLVSPDGQSGYFVVDKVAIPDKALTQCDQVICATNKAREHLNAKIRMLTNQRSMLVPPSEGDKVICLRNNQFLGVFNGMIGTIKKVYSQDEIRSCDRIAGAYHMDIETDTGNVMRRLPIWPEMFKSQPDKESKCPRKMTEWTYGYAITCHKSQGSEWENVVVFDQWMPPKVWDVGRWRYTAVTRASKKVFIGV